MNITPNIQIIDLALFLKKQKILIVSDFHLGYEESLAAEGVLLPRFQIKDTLIRLERILKQCAPNTIIINGDFKHDFGRIQSSEWRGALKVFDLLTKHSKKIILVKGNHDVILGPIAKKHNIEIVKDFVVDAIWIAHGDALDEKKLKKCKTIIIGHEHPAVGVQENARIERFKCFLVGTYKRKKLIVLPSFNLVVEGTDVLRQQRISPFLQGNLQNFDCYIIADKIYKPIKLKEL